MDTRSILYFLAIGLLAGWLAGMIMNKSQTSWPRNLVLGIIGAFLGGFVFSLLGLAVDNPIGSLVTATAGAVLFLFIINKFFGGKLPF